MEYSVNITYKTPKFHRRIFANLIDFIIFAFCLIGFFLGTRAVVTSTPGYKEKQSELLKIRGDSGLYYVKDDFSEDIVSYINEGNYSDYAKRLRAADAIDKFIAYVTDNVSEAYGQEIQADYDAYRLNEKFTYVSGDERTPYFIDVDGVVTLNSSLISENKVSNGKYYQDVYAAYIDNVAQGYLVTRVPAYLDLVNYQSMILLAVELPISWVLAGLVAYLLPALIFSRGKMTFGKRLYNIGLADKRLLSCSLPRYLARFAIYFIAVLTLGLFTFGISCLISFTMMAFSKRKQGFPDYMLGLYEIDLSQDKLYKSYAEITLEGSAESKEPVDFRLPDSKE